jgi:hypothetical protein
VCGERRGGVAAIRNPVPIHAADDYNPPASTGKPRGGLPRAPQGPSYRPRLRRRGVEPRFVEHDATENPWRSVWSLNRERRHITDVIRIGIKGQMMLEGSAAWEAKQEKAREKTRAAKSEGGKKAGRGRPIASPAREGTPIADRSEASRANEEAARVAAEPVTAQADRLFPGTERPVEQLAEHGGEVDAAPGILSPEPGQPAQLLRLAGLQAHGELLALGPRRPPRRAPRPLPRRHAALCREESQPRRLANDTTS